MLKEKNLESSQIKTENRIVKNKHLLCVKNIITEKLIPTLQHIIFLISKTRNKSLLNNLIYYWK